MLQTEPPPLRKLNSILELPNVTLALKDGKQFKAHQVILAATNAMAHTNYGELRQLFETFTRVWEAGGQTSLHLHTQNGQAKAFLEIQLGAPAAPRPGAPDVRGEEPGPTHGHQHHHVCPQQREPRRRGPAARARDTARRAAWLLQRQKNQAAPAVESSNVPLETRDIENTEVEANSVKTFKYVCELCVYTSQTEHGLNVHKGHKHKDMQKTPEKERSSSIQGDVSLSLTPSKETREEQCGNCGLEMSPGHQCEIWTDDKQDDKEETKEELYCDKCYVIFNTNAHLMKHIESNHTLGPNCKNHNSCSEKCREEPERCHIYQLRDDCWEKYRTKSKA